MKKYILVLIFSLMFLGVAVAFGAEIKIRTQLEMYSSLKDVAMVIFAVMGAWIAIIYPSALKNIFLKSHSLEQINSTLKNIFFPMKVATSIVIFSLAQEWSAPVLYKIDYLRLNPEFIRLVSFFILTIFVMLLLYSLLLTFLPITEAGQEVSSMSEHLKKVERRTAETTKRKLN